MEFVVVFVVFMVVVVVTAATWTINKVPWRIDQSSKPATWIPYWVIWTGTLSPCGVPAQTVLPGQLLAGQAWNHYRSSGGPTKRWIVVMAVLVMF